LQPTFVLLDYFTVLYIPICSMTNTKDNCIINRLNWASKSMRSVKNLSAFILLIMLTVQNKAECDVELASTFSFTSNSQWQFCTAKCPSNPDRRCNVVAFGHKNLSTSQVGLAQVDVGASLILTHRARKLFIVGKQHAGNHSRSIKRLTK